MNNKTTGWSKFHAVSGKGRVGANKYHFFDDTGQSLCGKWSLHIRETYNDVYKVKSKKSCCQVCYKLWQEWRKQQKAADEATFPSKAIMPAPFRPGRRSRKKTLWGGDDV